MFKTHKKFLILFLVLLVFVAIAGCVPEQGKISKSNPGMLNDYLFSVEPRNNGTYIIYVRNDDVAAYCTADKTIGEAAQKALYEYEAKVIIVYRNREAGDVENNSAEAGGCYVESLGSKTNTPIFKILDLTVKLPDGRQ